MVETMNALIISKNESGLRIISSLLGDEGYVAIESASTSAEAKEKLAETRFDLIVINSPLSDENGLELSVYCAEKTKASVILVVKQEKASEVFGMVDSHGVLVISKPLNRHLFHHYLIFTRAFKERMLATEQENIKLKTRLEEINIINRAKLLLIQCLSMTEQQAHRYLEKQAMNLRTSKLEISKQVIKTYDNQGFTGNKQ